MSCRPLDVESFRNRARLPKGITRRKRAGYDESKKVSRTLLIRRNPPGQVFHLSAHRALAELVAVAGFGPGTLHHHRWLAAVGNPPPADLRGDQAAESSGGFASGR